MSPDRWQLSAYTAPGDAGGIPPDIAAASIRFGSDVVVLAPPGHRLVREGRLRPLADAVSPASLHLVVQVGNRFEVEHPEVPVLVRRGRYLLVSVERDRVRQLARRACYAIEPIRAPDVVFDVLRARAPTRARTADVSDLLEELSRPRFSQSVEHLVSFGSRLSTSDGFSQAAEWSAGVLRTAGYAVRLDEIDVNGRRSHNVVAERPGTGAEPRELVVVTAHLDSVNHEQPGGPAPGADDNASGAAGVLELAACLALHPCATDLRFILFGGEEQGLHGSMAHVATLPVPSRIRAAVNMDMIASVNGTPAPTVLLEGGQVSRPVLDSLAAVAHTYTALTVQTSLHYFNSDHVPFIDAGIPGVLLIEGNDSANTRVHSGRDTIPSLDFDLMAEILRMHLAFLVEACGVGGPEPQ
jgi:hypothetical protein